MKKVISIGLFLLLLALIIGVVIFLKNNDNKNIDIIDNDKKMVITTLYPQYDFVKEIAKDKVNIKLLLPIGVESHTYEPTPKDIVDINNANIFLYTGDKMEPWVTKITNSINNENVNIVDCSKSLELINLETLEKKNNEIMESEEEHADDGHEHEEDPHIWLNPKNAEVIVKEILEELCIIDPENTEFYRENAKEYIEKLSKLDEDIIEMINNSKRKKIAFGGRFAFSYFIDRYDLKYVSAYDGCSTESEPSIKRVFEVIDYIKENNLPVIYYEEMVTSKIADTIAEETNAKKVPFYAVHNLTKDEFEQGLSYLEMMYKNLENLKEGLN